MDMNIPRDLLFTTDHTWLLVEDDEGTAGITDFGQSELTEIVYVELPSVGDEVVQGAAFGTVEAMKTVAELISPVSGEVIEVNEKLEDEPRMVNLDPYGEGWIIKVRIHEADELESLMKPEDYKNFVFGEEDDE